VNLDDLPLLNACLNSLSFILLVLGRLAIRKKNRELHKKMMISAFIVSTVFLCSYLTRHYYAGSTIFPGSGSLKILYFCILIPHVILAALMIPLILITFFHASKENWEKHRKFAKVTFPIWSYVSATGVIIYLMLYEIAY